MMVTNNEFQPNPAPYSMMNENIGGGQEDQFYNVASGLSTGGSF
jgi:hypothetical protein